MKTYNRKGAFVLGSFIDALSWDEVIDKISRLAKKRESSCVVICNVHSVVTAMHEPQHSKALILADIVAPDGAPIAWMLRRLGYTDQKRINGPDLMWKYCTLAEKLNESIFLYGSEPETLELLQQRLKIAFPMLKIAGAYSPPFHELTQEEDDSVVQKINASGAGSVWVSLGCPKQELWMAQHRGKVNAVMIGVGAAFDYHARIITRAPIWMQEYGLEWLHRLNADPKRLWKRYLFTNSMFIVKATLQLLKHNLLGRSFK